MTLRQDLIEARDLIAQGWTQGRIWASRDGVDCYCIVGAISEACMADSARHTAAVFAVRHTIGIEWLSIADWNDAHGRTQGDVLAILDRAIAECAS